MLNIEKNVPQPHQYLATGGFPGSLSGQIFTMITMDQMIEMTINKPPKVVGLTGATEKKGASERWMQVNHFLAALKQHLDLKIQRGQLSQHAEFSSIRMKKDEDHVKRVVAGIKLWVPDMWKKEQPLVNVCDGTIAFDEMVQNVLSARKPGEDATTTISHDLPPQVLLLIKKRQNTMTQ